MRDNLLNKNIKKHQFIVVFLMTNRQINGKVILWKNLKDID